MLGSLFSLLILYLHSTFAKLVTTLIDDAFPGDRQSSVSYSLAAAWGPGSSTGHGRVSPDASKAQFGTWHDTTADTDPERDGTTPTFMEVKFRGTGIDLRCIIANNKAADPAIPPFTGTKSNYSFFIDSVAQNPDFVHEAGTTGDAFLYNMSVFRIDGLSNGAHTVKLLANGGPGVDGSVLLLFDYAIVTSDDGTGDGSSTTSAGGVTTSQRPPNAPSTQSSPAQPSSSSPSAAHKSNIVAIVEGLSGGLLVFVLLLLVIVWLCRRRSQRLPGIPPFSDADRDTHRPAHPVVLKSRPTFTSRKRRSMAPSLPLKKHRPNGPAASPSSPPSTSPPPTDTSADT
ncbi:hypothetical protein C8J57DRAFT_1314106, partial [Mycena rebaudengoi]